MSDQGKTLLRKVNRVQMPWRSVDGEKLVVEDHPVRAIWEFVGRPTALFEPEGKISVDTALYRFILIIIQ